MSKRAFACFLVAVTAAVGCQKLAGLTGGSSSATPKTEDEKTFYTLGLLIGRSVGVFNLKPAELDMVKAGLTDSVLGKKPQTELEAYGPKVDQMARTRQSAKAEQEKGSAKAVADKAATEPGAKKLPSGLVMKSLKAGTGATPVATDVVKVNYEGRLADGTVFDSSIKRGQPAEFPLSGVIKCWTEGLQQMKVGEKAQLTCPSDIAYGDQGRPPTIPGGATLIFDVELLDIVKK